MFEIRVSPELEGWIDDFEELSSLEPSRLAWERATRMMYRRSQEVVHVITGELKASGSYEMAGDGDDIEGRVVYTAPQALFEELLGGDHAFLTRAHEDTQDKFDDAMMASWRRVFGR